MTSKEFLDAFKKIGVCTEGHFKLRSGRHSAFYIEKSLIYTDSLLLSELWVSFAGRIVEQKWVPDVVVAPETGGIAIEVGVAGELSMRLGEKVKGLYAEKHETIFSVMPPQLPELGNNFKEFEAICDVYVQAQIRGVLHRLREEKRIISEDMVRAISIFAHIGGFAQNGDELFVRKRGFVFKRGYEKLLSEKRVVLLDDILTTGGSLSLLTDAVRRCGGEVVGAAVIWNRGKVTAEQVGAPGLVSLVEETIASWTEEECKVNGPCARNIPLIIK